MMSNKSGCDAKLCLRFRNPSVVVCKLMPLVSFKANSDLIGVRAPVPRSFFGGRKNCHLYSILLGLSTCGPLRFVIAASSMVAREAISAKVGRLSVSANPHVSMIMVNRMAKFSLSGARF